MQLCWDEELTQDTRGHARTGQLWFLRDELEAVSGVSGWCVG